VGALIRAGHPGPCLAITAMAVAFAVGAGATGARVAVFALGVLAGQLSIGWSNDYADVGLDAGRPDKPIASGAVSARAVLVAAVVAAGLSLALTFALGPSTGLWSLPVVGAGWAYNWGVKGSAASGLMYLLGFGPIPAFATSILPGHPLPPWWTLAAAGLLGLGGHFANVLPDLAGDHTAGVRGLPQRVATAAGPTAVRLIAFGLLLAASALIAFAPGVRRLAVAGLAAGVALAVIGVRADGRTPFRCALAIAAIDVVMLLLAGAELA
jgi:4-hydroxybenzoate polyprenyltransferase